jgi:Glycosyl hydrolase family 26
MAPSRNFPRKFRESLVRALHGPTRRLSKVLVSVIAALALGGLALVLSFNAHAATPSNPSGLPWKSGVSLPDDNSYTSVGVNATIAFGNWRGKPIDAAILWPGRASWANYITSNSLYTSWAATSYTKVIGIPIYPAGIGDTVGACIAGKYNKYWSTFATTMVSTGLAAQGTIIRLGWEMNLHTDWGTPSQFAACWRDIVNTVKPIAPGLLWDWNVNRGSSGGMPGTTVLSAYPGNSYVDIVGVDSYDWWPPATAAGGWQTQLSGAYGLNYWLAFASTNGKQFSVPEWGLMPTASDGGGDDPTYISDMYNFFTRNAGIISFESYFDDPGTSLYGPDQYPNSAAEYAQLWGP